MEAADALLYDDFALVFMQMLSLGKEDEAKSRSKEKAPMPHFAHAIQSQFGDIAKPHRDSNTEQVFQLPPDSDVVQSFILPGFDFKICFGTDCLATVSGSMAVQLSLYFNRIASISYRMVVDGKAVKKTGLLTTDDLIALITVANKSEQWDMISEEEEAIVSSNVVMLEVEHLEIDEAGNWSKDFTGNDATLTKTLDFEPVFERYRACVLRMCDTAFTQNARSRKAFGLAHTYRRIVGSNKSHDTLSRCPYVSNYVYVDIWETVSHSDRHFEGLNEMERIAHIQESHMPELMGLMCQYTGEWIYRSSENFRELCGVNIALDLDMLIYANNNICVYIGTYGLRGGEDAPTDWQSILASRPANHVTEPEYLSILEMTLVQKHLIDEANIRLMTSALGESSPSASLSAIAELSQMNLGITKMIMELDAVRYSRFMSQKLMTQKTRECLHIEEASKTLERRLESVNTALRSIYEIKSLRNGGKLNLVLAAISIASLFQILFMETTIPFLESLNIQSLTASLFLIAIAFFLVVFGVTMLIVYLIRLNMRS